MGAAERQNDTTGRTMKKAEPSPSPEAYVAALRGWKRKLVSDLRSAVLSAGELEEKIKWGHLVYFSKGPVLLIRAEEERVLFGFWRGQRLRDLDPRLKPGGKYEMATTELKKGMSVEKVLAENLVTKAIGLNQSLGDPTIIK
jgi:hypothetical protein